MKHEHFLTPLEVKFAGGDEGMSFSGYGARFGNIDSYGDVIAPGAFTKTLKEAKASDNWPAMLLQHGSFLGGDDNMPVGVWTDMREDDKGLYVEGRLADTSRGRDAYTLLKMQPRPAITGMSIGFIPTEWAMRSKPEEPRRTLKAVKLMEVSLVTFPANDKARVEAVKSITDIKTIREFEEALTNGTLPALSAKEAKALLADGFKAIRSERDAGEVSDELAGLIRRNIATLSR
jgi:HK97 family phage prohead protease